MSDWVDKEMKQRRMVGMTDEEIITDFAEEIERLRVVCREAHDELSIEFGHVDAQHNPRALSALTILSNALSTPEPPEPNMEEPNLED